MEPDTAGVSRAAVSIRIESVFVELKSNKKTKFGAVEITNVWNVTNLKGWSLILCSPPKSGEAKYLAYDNN